MSKYDEVLGELGSGSQLGSALMNILNGEMPNIPFPTMGGHVFWNTIASRNGYKLQQNMITRHARILDRDDVRIAWGRIDAMMRVMDRMVKYMRDKNALCDEGMNPSASLMAMEQLKKLKELLDIGTITEDEYSQKKEKLLKCM